MQDHCYEIVKKDGKPQIIGRGVNGDVLLAKDIKSNQLVAIKNMSDSKARDQAKTHLKLNHPNIIKLVEVIAKRPEEDSLMIIEYAERGSLNKIIKNSLGLINKGLVISIFRDICEAVRYLHENNIMHRDIKPENILITGKNIAKLADFGLAMPIQTVASLCGTFEYMAPELLDKRAHDQRIDIWALGILLFELVEGHVPYPGKSCEQVFQSMRRSISFSSRFNAREIDLIKKILRVNPINRLPIQGILRHDYFFDNSSQPTKTAPTEGWREKFDTFTPPVSSVSSVDPSVSAFAFYNSSFQTALMDFDKKRTTPKSEPILANYTGLSEQGQSPTSPSFLHFRKKNANTPQPHHQRIPSTLFANENGPLSPLGEMLLRRKL